MQTKGNANNHVSSTNKLREGRKVEAEPTDQENQEIYPLARNITKGIIRQLKNEQTEHLISSNHHFLKILYGTRGLVHKYLGTGGGGPPQPGLCPLAVWDPDDHLLA